MKLSSHCWLRRIEMTILLELDVRSYHIVLIFPQTIKSYMEMEQKIPEIKLGVKCFQQINILLSSLSKKFFINITQSLTVQLFFYKKHILINQTKLISRFSLSGNQLRFISIQVNHDTLTLTQSAQFTSFQHIPYVKS